MPSSEMEKVEKLFADRSARARELKREGRRVIGYLCAYPPVELITAAGLVPYRITGSLDPVTAADAYLENMMCPFVRSCLDLALKHQYDFLDGVVWPHSCDNIQKTYDIFNHYFPRPFFHYLDLPHMTDETSFAFFAGQLNLLKAALEKFAGREITGERIRAAIAEHNRNRALLRELSALRKSDPPPLAGSEMMKLMLSSVSLPVAESNARLQDALAEIKSRKSGPEKKKARLLLYGSEIDDVALIKILEDAGANVVIEDICMGAKSYLHDVAPDGDPIANLAARYLGQITCPRTFRPWPGTREKDLESRFGYLRDLAREYGANGAILYIIMFCDTFEFDLPDARDFLTAAGIPCLHLEDDYSLGSVAALKTRIGAFLEMIGG